MKLYLKPKLLAITNHWNEKVLACPRKLYHFMAAPCDHKVLGTFTSDVSKFLSDIYCFHIHLIWSSKILWSKQGRVYHPRFGDSETKAPCRHLLLLPALSPSPLLLILVSPSPLGNFSSHITVGFDEAVDHTMLLPPVLPPPPWAKSERQTLCLPEIWIQQRTLRQKAVGIKGQPVRSAAEIPGDTQLFKSPFLL